jgi:hypothetical protein
MFKKLYNKLFNKERSLDRLQNMFYENIKSMGTEDARATLLSLKYRHRLKKLMEESGMK